MMKFIYRSHPQIIIDMRRHDLLSWKAPEGPERTGIRSASVSKPTSLKLRPMDKILLSPKAPKA